jgi:hypothetical protein
MDDTRAALEAAQEQRDKDARSMVKAMYDIANDLTYPIDEHGNVMNIHFMIPMLSFHLARCGYVKDPSKAKIIQQPVPGAKEGIPGVAEDAVRYVPVDAQGQLPEMFRKQEEEPPEVPTTGWHTRTHITLDGETIKGGG